jgi:heme A synthase
VVNLEKLGTAKICFITKWNWIAMKFGQELFVLACVIGALVGAIAWVCTAIVVAVPQEIGAYFFEQVICKDNLSALNCLAYNFYSHNHHLALFFLIFVDILIAQIFLRENIFERLKSHWRIFVLVFSMMCFIGILYFLASAKLDKTIINTHIFTILVLSVCWILPIRFVTYLHTLKEILEDFKNSSQKSHP